MEKANKFMPQLALRLNEIGFSTRQEQNGELSVMIPSGRGRKHELCVVGQDGEIYCNSGDLKNPERKEQIEAVLKTVEDIHSAMEASDAPDQGAMGGMIL